MAAVTRWVQYNVDETGVAGTGGVLMGGRGQRAFYRADAPVGDSFNIGTTNNRLWIKIDGDPVGSVGYGVTIVSGTDLDPRLVAKEITEGMHSAGQGTTAWNQAQCVWEDNRLKLYSGTLGSDAIITVFSGINTAHLELGFGTPASLGGTNNNTTGFTNGYYPNQISVSGTYNGFFDEIYQIVLSKNVSINTPVKDGNQTYNGSMTTGGVYNWNVDLTYTLVISTTPPGPGNGTTMNAGTGNVPTVSWTTGGGEDDGGPLELLYENYWYNIGTKGLMVKFSEGIFSNTHPNPAWTILCDKVEYVEGSNSQAAAGTARFVWSSNRGDDAISSALTTASGAYTDLGTRGLSISFEAPANLQAKDEFFVICTPPQPFAYGISNLNYGNVTVSTESPLRTVMFEIMSGAVEIDTVKFGLQNHGNFEHHGEGNLDTYFRYGTVGPGNNALIPTGAEWYANVEAEHLSDETNLPPTWLYATRYNLSVVADADSSEAIGVSASAGMVADPMWLNIKLGISEVGANSTINYRIYFDYS